SGAPGSSAKPLSARGRVARAASSPIIGCQGEPMEGSVAEWVNLVVRWFHVIAGIMWIGQTFLFNRLETRLAAAARQGGGRPSVCLAHSGGFSVVEKEPSPATAPPSLFWFKWESALTWMSGFVLLLVVYYGGGLLVAGPEAGEGTAIAV